MYIIISPLGKKLLRDVDNDNREGVLQVFAYLHRKHKRLRNTLNY